MPRGTHLTEFEKGVITGYVNAPGAKLSNREIARRINRSEAVIRNFLNDPDAYGKNKKGGRPQLLSARDKREISRAASNSMISLRQIKRQTNVSASVMTIHRALKSDPNIVRSRLMSAPRLFDRHKQARLEFSRENMSQNWSKVRFSSISDFMKVLQFFYCSRLYFLMKKNLIWMDQMVSTHIGEIYAKNHVFFQNVILVVAHLWYGGLLVAMVL